MPKYLGFEVLAVVVMKNSIFWDTAPCGPLKVKVANMPPAFVLISCSAYSSALKM
jgi:hypothetical protein